MRYLLLDAILEQEPVDWIGNFLRFQNDMKKKQQEALTSRTAVKSQSEEYPCPAPL